LPVKVHRSVPWNREGGGNQQEYKTGGQTNKAVCHSWVQRAWLEDKHRTHKTSCGRAFAFRHCLLRALKEGREGASPSPGDLSHLTVSKHSAKKIHINNTSASLGWESRKHDVC
ncbi:unnamed protein product, partial [Ectocarpus sp. 13 AM-2016]